MGRKRTGRRCDGEDFLFISFLFFFLQSFPSLIVSWGGKVSSRLLLVSALLFVCNIIALSGCS